MKDRNSVNKRSERASVITFVDERLALSLRSKDSIPHHSTPTVVQNVNRVIPSNNSLKLTRLVVPKADMRAIVSTVRY